MSSINAHQEKKNPKSVFAILVMVAFVLLSPTALLGCSGTNTGGESIDQVSSQDNGQELSDSDSVALSSTVPVINAPQRVGGLTLPEITKPEEMSDEEVASAERAIRAFSPDASDILTINNANSFYYYEHLTTDQRILYEGMITLLEDPTDDSSYITATLVDDADEDEIVDDFRLARLALQYDHPEYFWIYNGVKTDIDVGFKRNGKIFYMRLEKPYKGYKRDMTAFNNAVDEFLADIDTSESDAEVALAIHDKLVETVTYDYELAEMGSGSDLAHTAYGALVENSNGDSNTAVCDGYSQAYVYLLQQCGINAAVILGEAGDTRANAGGHAWSVVELDGEWYEVDVTWDDSKEDWLEALDEAKRGGQYSEAIPYYEEMLSDDNYMAYVEHYLFNLTTPDISDYKVKTALYYSFQDGSVATLVSDNVHIREQRDGAYEELMELAPKATGTKYAYGS